MGFYIITQTDSLDDAIKYAKGHVVISKRDLQRIKKLAEQLGFLADLLDLKIDVNSLDISDESDE